MTREPQKIDVLEAVSQDGASIVYERYEAVIPIASVEHDRLLKHSCEACKKFGLNFACPPHSPTFEAHVGDSTRARVIALRIPMEQFSGSIGEERYWVAYGKVRELLVEELDGYRMQGGVIAGSGACEACVRCALEAGDIECVAPDRRIYSLESLGVNVVGLFESAFGMPLEWSADETGTDFVSAIGAVFESGK